MKTKIAIFIIIATALTLRLLYFRDSLTFSWDQARDSLVAMNIWQNDSVKLLGPNTDIAGLHHGPLYWYLISPIYHFTSGNVWAVRLFLIFLNMLTLYFIYDLAYDLFKNKKVSLLSCLLFAVSFEAIQYARWLSNPAPALLTIAISFWALNKLIRGKAWAFPILLISWGLSVQLQIFMIYQILIFVTIWVGIKGFIMPRVTRRTYIVSAVGVLATFSTFIASEIKFKFQGTKSLLGFFKAQSIFDASFVEKFTSYIDRLAELFFLNIWGINLFFAGFMMLVTFYLTFQLMKDKTLRKPMLFLGIWILSPIALFLFPVPNAQYISIGALAGIIILTAYYLVQLQKKQSVLFLIVLIIIFAGNVNLLFSKGKEGDVLFTVQKQMILGDELKVIDWVYRESEGKPFRINTVTAPLFVNTTWAALFNWYGKSTYHHMPAWWGVDQSSEIPGSDIPLAPKTDADWHFLIIEPIATSDNFYVKVTQMLEDERSEVVERETFGYFTVEKRKITQEKEITTANIFHKIKNTDPRAFQ